MFEIFLGLSIAVAVLLSAVYYFFCAREIGKLTAEFKSVVDAQDVATALKSSELLAPVWKNFCKSGIAKLLSGVESAFVTSLVGISCAIAYGFVHHRLLRNFRNNLRRMNDRLDEIYPSRNVQHAD